MNLTDKINPEDITNKTWSDTPTKHIYEYGVGYTLNHITPKIAIDFTLWLNKNEYVKAYRGLDDRMCKEYDWSTEKSVEDLFQEFLEQYNFEAR